MIEFVTLLLGLVAGPQVVELTAAPEVAEVRLLLDGEPVAGDDEAPWRLDLDLGGELEPRLLEAVALDEAGIDESRHEVAEVRRYLRSLQVPLFVWRLGEDAFGRWPEWGVGERVEDFADLQRAARRLADSLDGQRVVWLEGLWLPNAIRLTERSRVETVQP